MKFDIEATQSVLTEATKNKGRKYKCPFCDYKDYKVELVNHIEKEHQDMTSESYTAARIVFNTINKKDHGTCVCGCGNVTSWREDLWRYDRYATLQCKERYSKEMKQRMVRKYGKEHLLDDMDMQEKMLENRSISGTYKFSKGGEASYVGTYEKKLLEFLDTVMNYRAIDVETPGPVIEYMYKGKKHYWITDLYLVPYNLVFDVKDGGDNPNTRNMEEYREKQLAKEKAIINQGKYNYIRLTNNNFSQLLLILAEIKESMMNNKEDFTPIIRVNESSEENIIDKKGLREYSTAAMGAMVGITNNPDSYVVPYIRKNNFTPEYGITNDENMEYTIITDDDGNITLKSKEFFQNECDSYMIFKYKKPMFSTPITWETTNLFEIATGKRILHPEQIFYDTDFTNVLTETQKNDMMSECYTATMISPKYKYPVINEKHIMDEFIMFYEDENGYFVENVLSNLRSKSVPSMDLITEDVIKYVSRGKLFE